MSDNLTYRALKLKSGSLNRHALRVAVVVVGFFCASSCKAATERLRIVSFNVQNLFDFRHDPGKNDWAFVPRSKKRHNEAFQACQTLRHQKWRSECLFQDWTPEILERKLQALAQRLDPRILGFEADFLVLQEIENAWVVGQLQKMLGRDRFPHLIHIEGDDPRGIEVAILSRWPLLGLPKHHQAYKGSRHILEARFRVELNAKPVLLTLLALHLPSAGNPRRNRVENLRLLNRLAESVSPTDLMVAAGDFNITRTEEREWSLIAQLLLPKWHIPHFNECKSCEGSFWDRSKKQWQAFDLIMIRRQIGREWKRIPKVHRFAPLPEAFDPVRLTGASDHFPVSLTLLEAENKNNLDTEPRSTGFLSFLSRILRFGG